MKICSLYGVGYYYIPGTDTCIKIGGYVRLEVYHNAPAGGSYSDRVNSIGAFTRHSNTFAMQSRFRLTADVRTQTEYGTLRSYFAFGVNFVNLSYENQPGAQFTTSMERAFIQFAGFTIGRSDTFFAFYNGAAYGLIPFHLDGSSGPAGHNVFAYTWQFGNGLSASLSIEDAVGSRQKAVLDVGQGQALVTAAVPVSDQNGQKVPDIVGNLRVDQAWGSAGIMGALHQVGGRYHNALQTDFNRNITQACNNPNTTACSHPGEEWGWAVGAGLTLKMPWDAKDTLSGVIAYSKGALGFVAYGALPAYLHKQGIAVGTLTDAVYGSPGSAGLNGDLELTEAWGGTIAFEHYWTPSLRTSWVAGYLDVSYNSNAKTLIATRNCVISGLGANAGNNNYVCDPDYSLWRLSSRTMWNPVANLDVGLEIAYTKVNTAFAGVATPPAIQGLQPTQYSIQDEDVWTATLRVQRSFWP